MDKADEFIGALKQAYIHAATPELALLIKYMSILAVLIGMKQSERIVYLADKQQMLYLNRQIIEDLGKLLKYEQHRNRNYGARVKPNSDRRGRTISKGDAESSANTRTAQHQGQS